jgi:ribosomal peptide maturation radical SAM protein 1
MTDDDVVLVSMPWQALESPSLPLGLLRSVCRRAGLPVPATYHGGMKWCEHLMTETDEEIGVKEYTDIAENGLFDGIGDWVFTGVLHDDPDFGVRDFTEYASDRQIDLPLVSRMRGLAAAFIHRAAEDVLLMRPKVVGFSTTFMQNVPSLALAKRLKELDPGLIVVFGGGNCDGDMGAALHRNFDFVDFVVRGEGEHVFPQLLRALDGDGDPAAIAGLCWREDGRPLVNSATGRPVLPEDLPVPDFDDWFELLEESPVAAYVEPQLVVETSRGCWWGEKHHCTFCGLNGSLMKFRAKTAERAISEITELVTRHKVLDIITVDNIIDNAYFNTVLPAVAELGWDLRIHYEVKSNLTTEQIDRCKDAGIAHVQPGIESLASPVLRIMDKGVTGARNVRTLRDCESASLTVSWNWLYGFPGERATDYAVVVSQLRALHHLQPPANAARILLERFSPYFENPALGFPERRPAHQYRYLYDLPDEAVHDMVYLFDTPARGLTEAEVVDLREAIGDWIKAYPDSTLSVVEDGAELVIEDRRVGRPAADHRITDPVLLAAYDQLEHGRSVSALVRHLVGQGHDVDEPRLKAWVDELVGQGLLFTENGQYLAVATRHTPVKVMPT